MWKILKDARYTMKQIGNTKKKNDIMEKSGEYFQKNTKSRSKTLEKIKKSHGKKYKKPFYKILKDGKWNKLEIKKTNDIIKKCGEYLKRILNQEVGRWETKTVEIRLDKTLEKSIIFKITVWTLLIDVIGRNNSPNVNCPQ